jgi:chemotaxis protein MotB
VQIAQLTDLLSMEKSNKTKLEDQLSQLRASLAGAESERDRLKGVAATASAGLAAVQGKVGELTGQVDSEKKISAGALSQVEILNQQIAALRRQLAAIEASLDISEKKDKESQAKIADLGQRLNLAMAQKVQELTQYRSDFFGRLREILGNRPDIRIVGDRFVLQSELLFDVGKAELKPEARVEIDKIAAAILELSQKIPPDIAWVLRVDGHTDIRPIAGPVFKSNWDLSAARAIAVVQYLAGKNIAPEHLVAAGFGEFQPLDTGKTEEAYRRNRRIEFKLTER